MRRELEGVRPAGGPAIPSLQSREMRVNKPLLGLVVGTVLGVLDGLSALVSAPETAPLIKGIVLGSTFKGLVTGLVIGLFARKVRSVPKGVVFGLVVGLLFAFIIAAMPNADGSHYYWQIMLPGGLLGLLVGIVTQRYGKAPHPATR
jgi:flagellar biosynthesis protein FliR